MAQTPTSTVALGYHSMTDWVFQPYVLVLYDKVIINARVFDEAIKAVGDRGYEATKARLLLLLQESGRLEPREYSVSDQQVQELDALFAYFLKHHPDDMRLLMIHAYSSYRAYSESILRTTAHPEDSYSKKVRAYIPSWIKDEERLRGGANVEEITSAPASLKRYFESALFSPLLFEEHNPVFQWDGYARIEEWLLGQRSDANHQRRAIRRGASLQVVRAIHRVSVPHYGFTTPQGLERLLEKWSFFRDVRAMARSANAQIWRQMDEATLVGSRDAKTFEAEFRQLLDRLTSELGRSLREAAEEVERRTSSTTFKFATAASASIGSAIPIAGHVVGPAIESLLPDLYRKYIEGRQDRQDGRLRTLRSYYSRMKEVGLSKEPVQPDEGNVVYVPGEFWSGHPEDA